MSTFASDFAMRSISCESSAMTPLVPINCSFPSCLICAFLLYGASPTNPKSSIANRQSRNLQSPITNPQFLLAGFPQEILETPPAALVHRRKQSADAVHRNTSRELQTAANLDLGTECIRPQCRAEFRRSSRRNRQLRCEQRTTQADIEQPNACAQVEPAIDVPWHRHARRLTTFGRKSTRHSITLPRPRPDPTPSNGRSAQPAPAEAPETPPR